MGRFAPDPRLRKAATPPAVTQKRPAHRGKISRRNPESQNENYCHDAVHEWLERDDSPLFGLVRDFYTQGGFAIGATVARHSTDDEFDIDVMTDLACRTDVDPEDVLATLDDAICGKPGSRYHLKTDRKTRCRAPSAMTRGTESRLTVI